MIKVFLLRIMIFNIAFTFGQSKTFFNSKNDKIKIPFELSHNLIIIDIALDNKNLKMIVDSGSESNLFFDKSFEGDFRFGSNEKITVKGIGFGDSIYGNFTYVNHLKIADLEIDNAKFLVIEGDGINLFNKLGYTINGVLGFDFFKDFLIEINYQRKFIILHKKDLKKKKYIKLNAKVHNDRFYLDVPIKFKNFDSNLKFLIDSGLSDGLWLFENDTIVCKTNFITDFLGVGFSGRIFGKRSRIDEINFSDLSMKKVIVTYPDSLSFKNIFLKNNRNGSIGGEVMKRFNWYFDFKNELVYIKKNSLFNTPFEYNMSGIEIFQSGLDLIKEDYIINSDLKNLGKTDFFSNNINQESLYKFKLLPVYNVYSVRQSSQAEKVGILVGDKLLFINGLKSNQFSIQEIANIFKSEAGKKIKITVERDGKVLNFEFLLEKIL